MTPFVKIFDVLSRALKPKTEAPSVTEDELKYIIDEIEEEGVLEEQESDLVLSALQFDETTVNDILIPRVKIVGVSSEATTDEICEMFLHSHFSRFPVYEKSMDNIIGMITSRDFFRLEHGMFHSVSEILQDVIYIPATKAISDSLKEMLPSGRSEHHRRRTLSDGSPRSGNAAALQGTARHHRDSGYGRTLARGQACRSACS